MAKTGPTTEQGHAGGFIPSWNSLAGGDSEIGALRWPQSVQTYHKMRTDSQIDALLRSVTLPIRRYHWELKPHDARPEIVDHVAADLGVSIQGQEDPPRTRKRFSHDDHLRHSLLGLVYGHIFFEQVGTVDDDLLWRLRKLAPRMPQSIIEIKVSDDGGLAYIKQNSKDNLWGGQKIDIDRLVAYVWEREGGNWVGRSMLRPLYSHYLIKDRLIRIDAVKNERYGVGIPTGHAPPGGDPDEYAKLAQEIRAGENSGVGLPHGASIGVEGLRGTLPDTIGSIKYHDEQMARTFLAMFMQLGSTQTGSRALGDSFVDFFDLSLEAVANWYADITNQHVIEDIVDWNYGEDEVAPELVWTKDEAQELGINDMATLIDLGILVVDEEIEHWVRERYRMPPRSEPSEDAPAQSDDEPLEEWARDADGLSPISSEDDVAVAAVGVRAHLPGKHDQRDHGKGTANVTFAEQGEWDETVKQANAKVAAAPVPSEKAVAKARADLENAKRKGGDSRGGSAADRRKQRESLFNEFDPESKGYVVCHVTGMKLHWSADPELNPEGFPLLERGKIMTKMQGGAYRLSNLLPESLLGNRTRGDEPVRPENMP